MLAVLPDGIFALPIDFGLFVGIAPDIQEMLVEDGCQVLVVKPHRAVDHGLHAIEVLDKLAELVHTVDELAA